MFSALQEHWQRPDGMPATREHLMMVLADLDDILIRASYHTEMRSSSISGVRMDVAVPNYTGLARAVEVEQCQCPPGYRGLSCQVRSVVPALMMRCRWMCIAQWYVAFSCVFFRTVQPDTLARAGACIWATASRANVTATLTHVTRKLVSARYEDLPSCSLFYFEVVLIDMLFFS